MNVKKRPSLSLSSVVSKFVTLSAACGLSAITAAEDLSELMNFALESDPRIEISEHQIDIAEAQDLQSLGRLFPQISAFGQYTHNVRTIIGTNGQDSVKDSYTGERYGYSVSQVIFDYNAFQNKYRTARLVDQSRFEAEEVISSVLFDVADRYITVLRAADDLELIRAEKNSVKEQLSRYEKLYDKGLIRVTDFLDARVRFDTSQADEIELINQLEVARADLKTLTGRPFGELQPLRENADFPVLAGSEEAWVNLARESNPTIQAARKRVEVAKSAYRQVHGAFMPRVELQFSQQHSDIGFENSLAPKTATNTVSLSVNMPIFAGGSRFGQLNEARSRIELEKTRREEALRGLTKSIREAFLNARSSERRIQAAQRRVESSRESYEAMRTNFKYGTVTTENVLDALQNQFEADRDLLRAKYNYLLSWLRVHYFSGQLLPKQVLMLSDLLEKAPSAAGSTK